MAISSSGRRREGVIRRFLPLGSTLRTTVRRRWARILSAWRHQAIAISTTEGRLLAFCSPFWAGWRMRAFSLLLSLAHRLRALAAYFSRFWESPQAFFWPWLMAIRVSGACFLPFMGAESFPA